MIQPQDGDRNCIYEALTKAGTGLASSTSRSSFFSFLLKFSWFIILCQFVSLQSFGHLMQRTNSLEKTLMLGKIEGRRRRGQQGMRWLDGITNLMDVSLSLGVGDGQGGLACCSSWGRRVGYDRATDLNRLL